MRRSISAQSVASVPPAPALIVMSAPRSSYSPREEQRGALALVRRPERLGVALDLGEQLGVVGLGGEVGQLLEAGGARSRSRQSVDLGAQPLGLAKDPLGRALVVPEAGRRRQRVELREARFLGGEVKAAPRSRGSARRGRGGRPGPSGPASQVLEQDRPELDEPQGGLAPGDDGVHAGAVRVVGADAAVAVAVKARGIAAVPAVALTGDEIDEAASSTCFTAPSALAASAYGWPRSRRRGPGRPPVVAHGPSIRAESAPAKREFSA